MLLRQFLLNVWGLWTCYISLGLLTEAKQQCYLRPHSEIAAAQVVPSAIATSTATSTATPTATSNESSTSGLTTPTPFPYGKQAIRGVNL